MNPTLFGIEIEMVREDWKSSGWRPTPTGSCICLGRKCKAIIRENMVPCVSLLPDGWRCEGDCSIPDVPYGIEMVSPRLPLRGLMDQLEHSLSIVKAHGYMEGPPEFCGMHVSVGQSGFIGERVKKQANHHYMQRSMFVSLARDPLTRMGSPSHHFRPDVGTSKRSEVNIDEYKRRIEFRHMKSCVDFNQIRRSVVGLVSTTHRG